VFLEVEELLWFDDREGPRDTATLQQMAECAGCGIACVVPPLEGEDRAGAAK
jgi:hypothetical protein